MKTIYIYKLQTNKYFFTTVPDNTSTTTKKEYEYVASCDIADDLTELSLFLSIDTTDRENSQVDVKIIADDFEKQKSEFECVLKESLKEHIRELYYATYTHDIFSNVYNIEIADQRHSIKFVLINNEQIHNAHISQYLAENNQNKIMSVAELDLALDQMLEEFAIRAITSLDIYVISMPISTNAYQTMRRRGSCMTTIDEYYIPSLNTSYNFYGEANILIGDKLDDRYSERYELFDYSDKKHVTKIHKILSGDELKDTLNSLKSYTTFKRNISKLYYVPDEE